MRRENVVHNCRSALHSSERQEGSNEKIIGTVLDSERNTTLDQNHWLTRQSAASITDTADTLGLDWLSPRKRYGANSFWRGQFLRELGSGLIVLTYSQNRPCTGPRHSLGQHLAWRRARRPGRHEPGRCAVARAPATSVTSTRRMH
jgi:hypothetical protein